ncbi:MAG: AAA family ATPase [Deltaproteobacteria bacterium]|nr:AAA family ATPase [Deltaproteobacteria bacterium]
MYLDFFGLDEEAFTMTPNPKFIYWTRQHESAAEALTYGITGRKGFLMLTGEVGTGKTTICREVMNRTPAKTEIAVVLNPLQSTEGLLKAIMTDFGHSIGSLGSSEEMITAFNHFLLKKTADGHNAVLWIDEAQNLSFEALEMIRLLSNLETDDKKLLQIVLVGQPELEVLLDEYRLRQLNQRISIRQRLSALNFDELSQYIQHRLFIAGNRQNIHFEHRALKHIYKYTQGSPRLTNVLCDRVLLAAYSNRTRQINHKLIKEAYRDLGWRS